MPAFERRIELPTPVSSADHDKAVPLRDIHTHLNGCFIGLTLNAKIKLRRRHSNRRVAVKTRDAEIVSYEINPFAPSVVMACDGVWANNSAGNGRDIVKQVASIVDLSAPHLD